jgi:dTMP kinase
MSIVVGVVCYRQMDDRDVPLWRDISAAIRGVPALTGRGGTMGLFVSLEGGDGVGKSTQTTMLADWLRDRGYEVVLTREPGATPLGKQLRDMLLDHGTGEVSPRAEALLYAADRAQHVEHVIRPALARGAVVITDRYIDSSLAYQGAGRSLTVDEVAKLSVWATSGLTPDLTVLLDLPVEDGLRRAGATGVTGPDRLESEPIDFHERVRQGFLTLARKEPDRYLVLDAGRSREEIQEDIRARIMPLLPHLSERRAAMATSRSDTWQIGEPAP